MIEVHCDKCGKELDEQGALIFAPPKAVITVKFHICKKCFDTQILPLLYKDDEDV